MKIVDLWRSYVCAGLDKQLSLLDRRRVYLIKSMIFVALLVFTFFTFFNLFISHFYMMLWVDFFGIFASLSIIYTLKKQKIELASTLSILMMSLALIFSIYIDHNEHFAFLYILFLPMVTIFLKGLKRGLIYALLCQAVIFAIIYYHTGAPDAIRLNITALTNILFVNFSITLLASYYELSSIETLKSLQSSVDREHLKSLKLHNSIEQFQSIFENISYGLLVIDTQSKRFIHSNTAMQNMLGYTKKELEKLNMADIHPKKELPMIIKKLDDQKNKLSDLARDIPMKRKDRTVFLADIDMSKEYLVHDTPYVAAIFRDATSRKEMITLLSQSYDRYEALFNQLPEAALMVNAQTARFESVNEASVKQYGYTKEEFLNMHTSDIDIFGTKEIVEERIQALESKGGIIFEAKHRCKDGSIIDVMVSAKTISFGDHVVISATCLNITEQKEQAREVERSNERYRSLFENLPQPAWVIDPETKKFRSVNKAFVDKYGYSKKEIKAMHMMDISFEKNETEFSEMLEKTLSGKAFKLETRHLLKNGDIINVYIHARKVIFNDKARVVAIITDITKTKYLQNELESLTYLLQEKVSDEVQKNREKDHILHIQSKNAQMGEMLNMIAHQWRQPLNAISASSIEISLKNSLHDISENDIAEHCLFVEDQTQNMSKTIDDFMEFFKPEQAKQIFSIQDLMRDVSSLIGVQIQSRGIVIHVDSEPDISLFSYKKELSHVVINIISNARDAFEERDIKQKDIWIRCSQQGEDVTLEFLDNAGGIDESILDKIFDPYFTTKAQGKGTGIGLYMSKRIVTEILEGSIFAENKEGGSLFSITFPNA